MTTHSGTPASRRSSDTRLRGFNLLELFSTHNPASAYKEFDFEIMADWGFNFARLPMSYWFWSKPDPKQWLEIDERPIAHVDHAIELGRQYGIHVNLNLHRIPGYCINGRELEPIDLFDNASGKRELAIEAACHHWAFFAKRYKGLPNELVSFDLANEPPSMASSEYAFVVKALVEAIRREDPTRRIVADGIDVGRTPVEELIALDLWQSGRGYDPVRVTHHLAPWMPEEMLPGIPVPTWPLQHENGEFWDKAVLRAKTIAPWKAIESKCVKVHIGEWGCYNKTPHPVALAWMADLLSLFKEAGFGWALWNLRGDFGPLDSQRADVTYEDFRGHKLDRRMLELLQAG